MIVNIRAERQSIASILAVLDDKRRSFLPKYRPNEEVVRKSFNVFCPREGVKILALTQKGVTCECQTENDNDRAQYRRHGLLMGKMKWPQNH